MQLKHKGVRVGWLFPQREQKWNCFPRFSLHVHSGVTRAWKINSCLSAGQKKKKAIHTILKKKRDPGYVWKLPGESRHGHIWSHRPTLPQRRKHGFPFVVYNVQYQNLIPNQNLTDFKELHTQLHTFNEKNFTLSIQSFLQISVRLKSVSAKIYYLFKKCLNNKLLLFHLGIFSRYAIIRFQFNYFQ